MTDINVPPSEDGPHLVSGSLYLTDVDERNIPAPDQIALRTYDQRKSWALDTIEVDARNQLTDDGHAEIDPILTGPAEVLTERTLAMRASTPITNTVQTTTVT